MKTELLYEIIQLSILYPYFLIRVGDDYQFLNL